MNNYFEFIMYLAFQTILNYEGKQELTIEELHNYRITLWKKETDGKLSVSNQTSYQQRLAELLKLNLDMNNLEEQNMFAAFIQNNSDVFTYSKGIISIKPEISIDKVRDLKFAIDHNNTQDDIKISGELISNCDCLECLRVLNITKITDEIEKIVRIEKAVEDAYQNFQDLNAQNQIRIGNYLIAAQISRISKMKPDKIQQYTRVFRHMQSMPDAIGDKFYLLSDYIQNNDEFYKGNDYIDEELRNKFQRAIFDTNVLAYKQLLEYLELLWMYQNPLEPIEEIPLDEEESFEEQNEYGLGNCDYEDEFDDEEYSPEDFDLECVDDLYETELDEIEEYKLSEKINLTFYLSFIKTLDDYQNKYGHNELLARAKSRLLYTLNSSRFNLFEEAIYQEKLSEISIDDFDYKEHFFEFYVMSRLFLIDILEQWIDDEYTLRKLLFIQTYYDLTKDIRIKRIIDKYQKTDIGIQVKTFVLEHKKFEDLSSNKLVKKLTKENNNI